MWVGVQATRNRERRCPHVVVVNKDNDKETSTVTTTNMRKQGKVYDVTEQYPRKPITVSKQQLYQNDAVQRSPPPRRAAPKPVDEDLYKIPPELLRTTKRVSHSL